MPAPVAHRSWPSHGTTGAQTPRGERTFVHDEEIWFSDGSVILLAHGRAFKVYQGLLANSSDVFQGLFSIPQSSAMETYEGCPIVRLTDHPEELRHLLRVLTNGKRYYRADEPLDFATVAALVRLSHKYQVDDVRDAYLARMKSYFCTDVKTWDVVSRNHGSGVMEYCDEDAIAAVNIAHLTGEESMLPSALFTCCLLNTRFLLDASPRLDGTEECLSAEETINCIDARSLLLQNMSGIAVELSDHVLAASVQRIPHFTDGCRTVLLSLRDQVLYLPPRSLLRGALSSRENTIRSLQIDGQLCKSCADSFCNAEEGYLRKFWARLPQVLGTSAPVDWPRE